MGKNDRKSRRGKIYRGTYGISRPRKKNKPYPVVKAEEIKEPAAEK